MSLEEEQARQRAAEGSQSATQLPLSAGTEAAQGETGPSSATESQACLSHGTPQPADGTPSERPLVLPLADDRTGQATSADDSEHSILQRALALSKGEADRDGDIDMAGNPIGSREAAESSADGHSEGDCAGGDEEMTEEEAIAHAIQMSLQDNDAGAHRGSDKSRR